MHRKVPIRYLAVMPSVNVALTDDGMNEVRAAR